MKNSCARWLALQRAIKTAFDTVASLMGLLLLLPVFLMLGLMIKLDSRGPVLFKQQRVGKDRRLFDIYKLRTMIKGAESKGLGYLIQKDDFRITRLGKFLRKYSLDELPQLINVLKQEMSLVGPRPTLKYQVDQYDVRQLTRLDVRPGITGLAQIRGRNGLSWPERIECDIQYIHNWSLWLDFKIILGTIKTIAERTDVYTSDMSKFKIEVNK